MACLGVLDHAVSDGALRPERARGTGARFPSNPPPLVADDRKTALAAPSAPPLPRRACHTRRMYLPDSPDELRNRGFAPSNDPLPVCTPKGPDGPPDSAPTPPNSAPSLQGPTVDTLAAWIRMPAWSARLRRTASAPRPSSRRQAARTTARRLGRHGCSVAVLKIPWRMW